MLTIDSINQYIQSKFSPFVQKGISISPHFVPLNLKLLEKSIGGILKNGSSTQFNPTRFRDLLFRNIRNKFSNTVILNNNSFTVNGKSNISLPDLISKFTPALVFTNNNSKDNLVGVLFNSYQAATAALLNTEISKLISEELKGLLSSDSGIDLAYILRNEENSTKGIQIKNFLGIFNSISNNTVSSSSINIPNNKAGVIQSKIMVDSLLKDYAIYEERKFGTYSITINKEVSNFVTSIKANILIFHDVKAKQEIKQIVESKGFLSTIGKLIPKISILKSSFIDDVKNRIRNAFLGKPSKAIRASTKTSKAIKGAKSNVKVNNSRGIQSEFIIPPAYRSLVNLQNLINANLAEAVKDRMGTGERADILNYDTGRLAESFKVTTISQDREGALTAFFTYMKYPYATFSSGGVQQDPRSRDPILLGERAIRDIGANILKERLRGIGI